MPMIQSTIKSIEMAIFRSKIQKTENTIYQKILHSHKLRTISLVVIKAHGYMITKCIWIGWGSHKFVSNLSKRIEERCTNTFLNIQ